MGTQVDTVSVGAGEGIMSAKSGTCASDAPAAAPAAAPLSAKDGSGPQLTRMASTLEKYRNGGLVGWEDAKAELKKRRG
jgi:hypothetical protein